MGYGEFGGGGSVQWRIVGSNTGDAGYDPVPPHGQGKFLVKINTGTGAPVVIGPFPIQDNNPHQIQIIWTTRGGGPEAMLADETADARATAQARAAKIGDETIAP